MTGFERAQELMQGDRKKYMEARHDAEIARNRAENARIVWQQSIHAALAFYREESEPKGGDGMNPPSVANLDGRIWDLEQAIERLEGLVR